MPKTKQSIRARVLDYIASEGGVVENEDGIVPMMAESLDLKRDQVSTALSGLERSGEIAREKAEDPKRTVSVWFITDDGEPDFDVFTGFEEAEEPSNDALFQFSDELKVIATLHNADGFHGCVKNLRTGEEFWLHN